MKLMAPSLDNSFRRRVRSGAKESQFNSLLEIVQVINLVSYEDRYFWSLESEGDYSVASIRKLIDEKRFQEGLKATSSSSYQIKIFLQTWRAKEQAKKIWEEDSTAELQKGQVIDGISIPLSE
nr:RNA-directed DNA polymerase, eukaryota [Tanacetum cinerariifolium]